MFRDWSNIPSSVFKFSSTQVDSGLPRDFTRHLAGVYIITCLSKSLGGEGQKAHGGGGVHKEIREGMN